MALSREELQDIIAGVVEALGQTKPPPVDETWKNGHSVVSDINGGLRIKEVDEYIAKASPKDQEWLPNSFVFPQGYMASKPLNELANFRARTYLSDRNFRIWGVRSDKCTPITVIETPRPGPDVPWDDTSYKQLVYGDDFVPKMIAWGWDDKHVDAAFILQFVKDRHARGP